MTSQGNIGNLICCLTIIQYSVEKDTKLKILVEQPEEEIKIPEKDLLEMAIQFKFDFSLEDPIKLGEVDEKVTILKELMRLRFEAAEEMQKGGIMQVKGVILSKFIPNYIL